MKHQAEFVDNENKETPSAPASEPQMESLEQRLKRLEDAIASLQDTRDIEDRLAERVREEIRSIQPSSDSQPDEKIAAKPAQHGSRITQLFFPGSGERHEESEQKSSAAASASNSVNVFKETWFLLDAWKELRAMIRMFFDVRYRVAWTVRIFVIVLLAVILLSHLVFTIFGITVIGPILDKIFALFLGFFLYKALSREARHYMLMQEGKVE